VTALNTPINWRQENARLDWSISDRTRLILRYTQDSGEQLASAVDSLG